jgi:cellulose synthase/poly-beta-1,6-N-acetylglucosamine synthase-like glycosyltransferase
MIPFFTIIIPVKSINDYVRETVPYIQNLCNRSWELIILPNDAEPDEWNDTSIQIVPSGRVGPAKKRDMGAGLARGEILVFLDDDSYPEPHLLTVAEHYFTDNNVVALGGPAMTPPHDTFWQRVSGAVFLSKFSGGAPERYIPLGEVREIQDWPSVNLMVRKADFLAIGGFDSPYWPGEDTKLCLDLVKKTGKKILYVPKLVVWHHRRAGLVAHLRQIGGYGLHRGYFAKKYPETSRKLSYFVPSAFLSFVALSFLFPWLFEPLRVMILAGWGFYGVAMLFAFRDISRHEAARVAVVAIGYTFFTHIYYGARFIQGLLTQNLVSRLR